VFSFLAVHFRADGPSTPTWPSIVWRPAAMANATFAVIDLATFYGSDTTIAQVLRRMRCSGACGGGRVGAAWLVTEPILNARIRPRRVPLLGREARE
jgi:hypothetical protein